MDGNGLVLNAPVPGPGSWNTPCTGNAGELTGSEGGFTQVGVLFTRGDGNTVK